VGSVVVLSTTHAFKSINQQLIYMSDIQGGEQKPVESLLDRIRNLGEKLDESPEQDPFDEIKKEFTRRLYDESPEEFTRSLTESLKTLDPGSLNRLVARAESTLDTYPDHNVEPDLAAEIHYGLGIAYFYRGEFDKAISKLERALELNPKCINAYFILGIIHRRAIKDNDKAIEYLEKYIRHDASSSGAYDSLGMAYLKKQDIDKAIECFEKMLEIGVAPGRAHRQISFANIIRGDFEKATEHLEKSVEIDPEYTDVLYWLGMIHSKAGNPDKAAMHFEEFIKHNQENAAAYLKLSRIYAEGDKPERALELLEKAVKLMQNGK